MNKTFRKSLPVILAVSSSLGVVLTGILVALNAEKANEAIREATKIKSKKEIIKAFLKGYYPALIMGTVTISAIVSGTIISKKIEASLTATALILDTTLRKYQNKLKELFGDKADVIVKSIMQDEHKKLKKEDITVNLDKNGDVLYYEEHVGFFKAKPSNIARAIDLTNIKIYKTQGWSSLKEFLRDSKAKSIEYKDIDKVSYDYGWFRDYILETYNKTDMEVALILEPHFDKDGIFDYYHLKFDKDPIFGVSKDYLARVSGYNAGDLDDYENNIEEIHNERDVDAAALLYDELKVQFATKKRGKKDEKK